MWDYTGHVFAQVGSKESDEYQKESYDMVVDYAFTTEDLGALYEQFTNCDSD